MMEKSKVIDLADDLRHKFIQIQTHMPSRGCCSGAVDLIVTDKDSTSGQWARLQVEDIPEMIHVLVLAYAEIIAAQSQHQGEACH